MLVAVAQSLPEVLMNLLVEGRTSLERMNAFMNEEDIPLVQQTRTAPYTPFMCRVFACLIRAIGFSGCSNYGNALCSTSTVAGRSARSRTRSAYRSTVGLAIYCCSCCSLEMRTGRECNQQVNGGLADGLQVVLSDGRRGTRPW